VGLGWEGVRANAIGSRGCSVLLLVLVGVGLEGMEAAGRIQEGSEDAGVFHFF
jgi:hypothetical protein